MQKMRLETKDGIPIAEIDLPAHGEPDAITVDGRVFIRRAQRITEPPTKNNPETYYEATTHHVAGTLGIRSHFDKVTETIPKGPSGDFDRVTEDEKVLDTSTE